MFSIFRQNATMDLFETGTFTSNITATTFDNFSTINQDKQTFDNVTMIDRDIQTFDNVTMLNRGGPSPEIIQAYNIYLYIMITLGVPGNFLVIFIFLKHHPSTTTDWFILGITTCDFVTSLINVPIYVTFTNGIWKLYGNNILCQLHMFVGQSLVFCSSFLVAGLAMDRYLKVCKPTITSFSKTKARNSCFIMNIFTTLLSIPCFVMYQNSNNTCQPVANVVKINIYYIIVLLIFVIAAGIVVFSYVSVAKVIKQSDATMWRHRQSSQLSMKRNPHTSSCSLNQVAPRKDDVASCHDVIETLNCNNENNSQRPCSTDRNVTQYSLSLLSIGSGMRDKLTTSKAVSTEKTTSVIKTTSSVNQTAFLKQSMASLRTTKIAFLVCAIYVITWIPPWAIFILSMSGQNLNGTLFGFKLFGKMTYLINTITNPVLYTWLNRKFRRKIQQLLCCGHK